MGPEDARSHAGHPRRRRWIGAALFVAVVATIVGGYLFYWRHRTVAADRIELASGALADWNVVLVSMDTVRRDRLHCYGRDEIDTPTLDRLAREGIRFDQAVTAIPMTLPSHSTMLTGLTPRHHGARVNGMFRLNEEVATLQGVLRGRGYHTGGVIAAFVLDRQYGLSRGFDHYDDDLSSGRKAYQFSYRERQAEQVNAAALAWLRDHVDKPFFLFVHYFDPHWPYDAPEPFGGRYRGNHYGDYDGEIAYTDDQLGKLIDGLEALGVRDRTLLVVTSDHGEGLKEHDENTHSMLLYDSTLRVPLIFSGPAPVPHRRLVSRQVGLVDLMPTILDLLGAEIPPGLDGVSLLAPPEGGPRALYIETLATKFMHGWAPLVGVRRDDFKFVLAPRRELFDLRADPNELSNLYTGAPDTALAFYEILKDMVGGDPHLVGQVSANLTMDEEARKKLAALGYVITTSAPTSTTPATRPEALPDPKDMILAQHWVLQAQTMVSKGQFREGLTILEPYLEEHPGDALALHVAGECYQQLGKRRKALEAFRRASQMNFERPLALARMGTALMLLNRLDEAEAACRQALELDSKCMNAYITLGWIRAKQDQEEEAMALFQRVVDESRGTADAPAYMSIGKFYLARGKTEQARQAFEKALAIDPNIRGAMAALASLTQSEKDEDAMLERLRASVTEKPMPDTLLKLGQLEAKKGSHVAAERAFRRVLALQSENAEAYHELARALQQQGKVNEALIALRESLRLRPRNPAALTELGMILVKRDRLDEARGAFQRAVAANPRSATCRYNYGLALARLKDFPEAARQFRAAVKLQPGHARAHHNLGLVLRMQGQVEQAARHLQRAAEIDPTLSQARKGSASGATR